MSPSESSSSPSIDQTKTQSREIVSPSAATMPTLTPMKKRIPIAHASRPRSRPRMRASAMPAPPASFAPRIIASHLKSSYCAWCACRRFHFLGAALAWATR